MFKVTGVAAGSVKPPQVYIVAVINVNLYENNRHNIHFFCSVTRKFGKFLKKDSKDKAQQSNNYNSKKITDF